jgi:hypothetical protein
MMPLQFPSFWPDDFNTKTANFKQASVRRSLAKGDSDWMPVCK